MAHRMAALAQHTIQRTAARPDLIWQGPRSRGFLKFVVEPVRREYRLAPCAFGECRGGRGRGSPEGEMGMAGGASLG